MQNKSTKTLFIHLLFLVAFSFFNSITIKGQSFLMTMDNGLNAPVNASCEDSLGNYYAVTHDFSINDTAYINKWNAATRKWSVYAKLGGIYNSSSNSITAQFLYGKLFVTAMAIATGNVNLWEYNGTWKQRAIFKYNFNFRALNSVKFKNKIYYAGPFDSINSVGYRSIAVFDGSSFTNAGYPYGGYNEAIFAISNDSLYVTSREKILLHKSPNSWSVYHTNTSKFGKSSFESLVVKDNLLYASVYNSGYYLVMIDKGKVVDSVLNPGFNSSMNLLNCQNKLFISCPNNVHLVEKGKDIKYLFRNQNYDSSHNSFYTLGGKLYYYGANGVKVDGVDYHNILEILVDSLKPIGFDTILGKVFWDRNNDYVPNGSDVFPSSGFLQNVTESRYAYLTNNTGTFTDIVLNDRNATYKLEQYNFDSCVQAAYSGNISASNTNPGVTRDTIYFPLTRPTAASKNLVLRSYTWPRARLLDTIPLTVLIRNKDCDCSATTNVTVRVTLAPNTVFVSATPAPTSNSGNTYVFSNVTLNYGVNNLIKLKVVYPNTKFKIDDQVRHFARVDNITGEDTLDNMDSIRQVVSYSYDPNAKHSVPEGKITTDLKNIRYYIDFQNLGTDDARKVTVVDTMNLKIPVYEFRMVAASHPYTVSIAPGTNIVTWVFDNINLKPKAQNEAASKGYIIFEAKLRTNVGIGDSIRNKASIYFDYNDAVITNFAVVQRVDPKNGSVKGRETMNGALVVYPNPGHDYINLGNKLSKAQQIMVYDLKGARIATVNLKSFEIKKVETDVWAKGMYLLVNDAGHTAKIIIE